MLFSLNNKTRCFLVDLKQIPDLSYIIVVKFSCFSSHAWDACTRYPPDVNAAQKLLS